MGLIESARDALQSLPLSDILRERLSLAIDRLSEAEAKISVLTMENGALTAKNAQLTASLEHERLDHQQTKQELHDLRAELEEEVRLFSSIEFRRGKRTNGQWLPFCPSCHIHVNLRDDRKWVFCSKKCGWVGQAVPQGIDVVTAQIDGQQLS